MVDTMCCVAAVVGAIIIGVIYIILKFATPISIWSAGRNVKKGLQSQQQTIRYEAPPPQPQPQYYPQQQVQTCLNCQTPLQWDQNQQQWYCPHCQIYV